MNGAWSILKITRWSFFFLRTLDVFRVVPELAVRCFPGLAPFGVRERVLVFDGFPCLRAAFASSLLRQAASSFVQTVHTRCVNDVMPAFSCVSRKSLLYPHTHTRHNYFNNFHSLIVNNHCKCNPQNQSDSLVVWPNSHHSQVIIPRAS